MIEMKTEICKISSKWQNYFDFNWSQWPLENFAVIPTVLFLYIYFNDRCHEYLQWNCLRVNGTRSQWWVNISPGNGLVSLSTEPLPELMLTEMFPSTWHRWATMSSATHVVSIQSRDGVDVSLALIHVRECNITFYDNWHLVCNITTIT